jgi:hypothetical protein
MKLTKAEAEKKGKALRELMNFPKAWSVRVWQNMGWHYSIDNGYMSIRPTGFSDGEYFILASEHDQHLVGSQNWLVKGNFKDPNNAVATQVDAIIAYRDHINKMADDILRRAVCGYSKEKAA